MYTYRYKENAFLKINAIASVKASVSLCEVCRWIFWKENLLSGKSGAMEGFYCGASGIDRSER